MFGNFSFLNRIIATNPDCPIKEDIGDKTQLKIIEVIVDEYWREIVRMKQFSHSLAFNVPNLGVFKIRMSPLKKYVYLSIKQLRRLRKRIENQKLTNPNFDPENSLTVKIHDDLEIKVKAAWAQLNSLREIIILRTIRSNHKKRMYGNEDQIKVTYENYDWKFIDKYIKDNKD